MHISEGVLSPPVLAVGGVVTAVGTAVGLKTLNYDRIMTVAMLTATFFVASLIHVPIGPGNVHLILGGILGIVLGWSCFPAILIALLLQTLFFNFGGLLVLGVNTAVMALPPLCCYYLFRRYLLKGVRARAIAAFAAGFLSILCSSVLMALALASTDQNFVQAARLIVLAHVPLMFVEGIITMFAVSFLLKVQPDLLNLDNFDNQE